MSYQRSVGSVAYWFETAWSVLSEHHEDEDGM